MDDSELAVLSQTGFMEGHHQFSAIGAHSLTNEKCPIVRSNRIATLFVNCNMTTFREMVVNRRAMVLITLACEGSFF